MGDIFNFFWMIWYEITHIKALSVIMKMIPLFV